MAKRQAALRYLDENQANDTIGSGLNDRGVLSLAWAAVQDKSVFPSQQDAEDRAWGLLEALANIQRAHNDCPQTGAIDWHKGADAVSCTTGQFKRLLEHLDKLHPDVKINPEIKETHISIQMIVNAIQQEDRLLRSRVPTEECHRIRKSFRSSDKTFYHKYLNRLRESVHSANPSISLDAITDNTGEEMMEALFETREWEECSGSSSQAACQNDRNSNQ